MTIFFSVGLSPNIGASGIFDAEFFLIDFGYKFTTSHQGGQSNKSILFDANHDSHF